MEPIEIYPIIWEKQVSLSPLGDQHGNDASKNITHNSFIKVCKTVRNVAKLPTVQRSLCGPLSMVLCVELHKLCKMASCAYMKSLDKEAPSVATEFGKGHFVVQKSHRAFSSIPTDQAHEQNNRIVKGDGGAIGLTENSCQLLRWMVCGPEISRLINEFKCSEELTKKRQSEGPDLRHHEQMFGVKYRRNGKSFPGGERGSSCAGHM